MTDAPAGGSFETVSDFVSTAKGVVATGQNLDEANTKAKILTPLIRTLGWQVYSNDEVLLEYSGEEGFNDRVDYALFGPDGLYAVVEAKQIGHDISNDDDQVRRYMRLFGADWGVLTNGERYLIYEASGESDETLVESVKLDNLPSSPNIQNLTRQSAYAQSVTPDTAQDPPINIPRGIRENIEEFVTRKRADDPNQDQDTTFGPLYDSLVELVAPSLEGHETEKLGILFYLAGGVRKTFDERRSIRGAIHILFVSDSGVLTESLAETAANLAPHGVYLSNRTNVKQLLTTQKESPILSPEKIPSQSYNTLVSASHAIVTQFNEIDQDEFDDMADAFSAEIPPEEPDSSDMIPKTTGLLATSRPEYGTFDEYEPIQDQLDIDSAVLSEFDLIFVLTDGPDDTDYAKAEKRIKINEVSKTGSGSDDWIVSTTDDSISSGISLEELQAYLTYVRNNYHPSLTDQARQKISEFYTRTRSESENEDGPVPLTLKKIDVATRLAESSARLRLSEEATEEDASRAIETIESTLSDLGVIVEDVTFDADIVETGTSKEQRDRIRNLKDLIGEIEDKYEKGAPVKMVVKRASEIGLDASKAEHEIEKLKQKGEVYEPATDHLRTS